jgi:hypothetical protein
LFFVEGFAHVPCTLRPAAENVRGDTLTFETATSAVTDSSEAFANGSGYATKPPSAFVTYPGIHALSADVRQLTGLAISWG